MPQRAPGRAHRKGISLAELFDMFPDEAAAERWFVETRWPNGVACPKCGSVNVQSRPTCKPQPFRCRDCRRDFSIRTGTVMHGSKLPLRTWAIGAFMMTTDLKGRSSLKVHRDLKITQKTAWFLGHRLREAYAERQTEAFRGPVEIDETYLGGRRDRMHASKRAKLTGRGGVGKTVVAAIRDRKTRKIAASVVPDARRGTLTAFMRHHVRYGAETYTDSDSAYARLPNHKTVNHSRGEYVRGPVHVNGCESFFAMLKRAHKGTFHSLSEEQMPRYIAEFSGRHNVRDADTIDQLRALVRGMEGKRLRYSDLIDHGPGQRAVTRGLDT